MKESTSMLWGIVLLGLAPSTSAHAAYDRTVVVISDLHAGPGRTADSQWDAYEDFRWAQDLDAFLGSVNSGGQQNVDLILDGDTFELWQSRDGRCQYSDHNLGCSEQEALLRLQHAIASHRQILDSISAFAARADNRVIFLPGNHDVALLFPSVWAALRSTFPAASRIAFNSSGSWRTADGALYVDHGHQLEYDVNAFDNWPKPFREIKGVKYVTSPWGEQMVASFYNQYESRYPIIDNLWSDGQAIRFGLAKQGWLGSVSGVWRFLKLIAIEESWRQFGQVLGGTDQGEAGWDYEAIAAMKDEFLAETFSVDDPLRTFAEQARLVRPGGVAAGWEALSKDDVNAICEWRKARAAKGEDARTCPRKSLGGDGAGTLGAALNAITGNRNKRFSAYLNGVGAGVRTYVFGHTHVAEEFRITLGPDQEIHVVNSGAFQRRLTEAKAKEWQKKNKVKKLAPRCLKWTPG